MRILIPVTALVCLTLALAACGSSSKPAPSSTAQPSVTPATSPTAPSTASEAGETPIFWRTADGFASLEAGVGYKVVFRITNGYAEPALSIMAVPEDGGASEQFEAQQVQPGAGEAAGSYYAINIDLPRPGRWQLTVVAGADQATIHIEAVRMATAAG